LHYNSCFSKSQKKTALVFLHRFYEIAAFIKSNKKTELPFSYFGNPAIVIAGMGPAAARISIKHRAKCLSFFLDPWLSRP
jgi:hypothetical protein